GDRVPLRLLVVRDVLVDPDDAHDLRDRRVEDRHLLVHNLRRFVGDPRQDELDDYEFPFVLARWAFFVRCVLRRRPASFSARSSSVIISSAVATASFDSDVYGTFVEQRWTRTISGPNGKPCPPRCSRPYRLQSTFAPACVSAHPPAWYRRGTRSANRRTSIGWSGGRSPP